MKTPHGRRLRLKLRNRQVRGGETNTADDFHPYGVESAALEGGVIAMELVEGEDLARRLERGRIPVGEALEIAGQIADALEQAHGTGIVHRDLKPGNIKLAPDGGVSARPTPAPARSAA